MSIQKSAEDAPASNSNVENPTIRIRISEAFEFVLRRTEQYVKKIDKHVALAGMLFGTVFVILGFCLRFLSYVFTTGRFQVYGISAQHIVLDDISLYTVVINAIVAAIFAGIYYIHHQMYKTILFDEWASIGRCKTTGKWIKQLAKILLHKILLLSVTYLMALFMVTLMILFNILTTTVSTETEAIKELLITPIVIMGLCLIVFIVFMSKKKESEENLKKSIPKWLNSLMIKVIVICTVVVFMTRYFGNYTAQVQKQYGIVDWNEKPYAVLYETNDTYILAEVMNWGVGQKITHENLPQTLEINTHSQLIIDNTGVVVFKEVFDSVKLTPI